MILTFIQFGERFPSRLSASEFISIAQRTATCYSLSISVYRPKILRVERIQCSRGTSDYHVSFVRFARWNGIRCRHKEKYEKIKRKKIIISPPIIKPKEKKKPVELIHTRQIAFVRVSAIIRVKKKPHRTDSHNNNNNNKLARTSVLNIIDFCTFFSFSLLFLVAFFSSGVRDFSFVSCSPLAPRAAVSSSRFVFRFAILKDTRPRARYLRLVGATTELVISWRSCRSHRNLYARREATRKKE